MTDKKMADPKASQNSTPSNVNTAANAGTVFVDIRRSDSERLRVAISEFKGRTYVDLRVWYSTDAGELKPSSKGVSLKPSQIPEVVQGLLLAANAFDPSGGA
jgi:hypothetical protein